MAAGRMAAAGAAPPMSSRDDLDPARGIVYAVLGSLVLWLILAGVIAYIWSTVSCR